MQKPIPELALHDLRARIGALPAPTGRRMIGITGPPGAGKSTLAEKLRSAFAEEAAVVPMDGFHLANTELHRLGLSHRKGAELTFDGAGYVALLQRLRRQAADETVYAPEFRREVEEPIAGAIPVFGKCGLVITEGNYLLLEGGPWARLPAILDEIWYLDIDSEERRKRLIARHIFFGKTEEAAKRWVADSDDVNAAMIEASRSRAGFIFRLAAET